MDARVKPGHDSGWMYERVTRRANRYCPNFLITSSN
jgi:hypothetical protein